MKISITAIAALALLLGPFLPAHAEDASKAPPVDKNKTVTLTIADIETLLVNAKPAADFNAVVAKINAQVATPAPTPSLAK